MLRVAAPWPGARSDRRPHSPRRAARRGVARGHRSCHQAGVGRGRCRVLGVDRMRRRFVVRRGCRCGRFNLRRPGRRARGARGSRLHRRRVALRGRGFGRGRVAAALAGVGRRRRVVGVLGRNARRRRRRGRCRSQSVLAQQLGERMGCRLRRLVGRRRQRARRRRERRRRARESRCRSSPCLRARRARYERRGAARPRGRRARRSASVRVAWQRDGLPGRAARATLQRRRAHVVATHQRGSALDLRGRVLGDALLLLDRLGQADDEALVAAHQLDLAFAAELGAPALLVLAPVGDELFGLASAARRAASSLKCSARASSRWRSAWASRAVRECRSSFMVGVVGRE